ncbi:unnamed protein product [Lupinus luteus]|uniref:NHL repeat-containing protein n=1 Tax=Lupinus luteus TaxID=3873 RepID=A0AAV1WVW5_LUPLU
MASPSTFHTLTLFLLLSLLSFNVYAKIVIPEDGYTVTTVLDGQKVKLNPHSVFQKPSSSDLILLDSANSAFYTLQFPMSKESVLTRFSGNGNTGYSDGDVGSAQFDKPRSFAVDFRGNVYVADKNNRVIRKISGKSVTTIAGGFSEEKSSRKDGAAQNVSFSNDFELSFAPEQCALLVSDHMYQLVRKINLKEEDCTFGSKSGLGAVMIWSLGLGLSCLLGLVIGIAVRPYIIPNELSSPCRFIETWKHCLTTSLGKLVPILYFGIKNAVASCSFSSVYTVLMKLWQLCISQLLLMFRINIFSRRPHLESVSLLDLDACNSGEVMKSSKYDDQLKDLISFDGIQDSTDATFNQGYSTRNRSSVILQQGSSVCNLGMVKRK